MPTTGNNGDGDVKIVDGICTCVFLFFFCFFPLPLPLTRDDDDVRSPKCCKCQLYVVIGERIPITRTYRSLPDPDHQPFAPYAHPLADRFSTRVRVYNNNITQYPCEYRLSLSNTAIYRARLTQVREVSGKIRALISAIAPLFSAQLVLFNPTFFGISAVFPSEI
jgi:hypothetical protein